MGIPLTYLAHESDYRLLVSKFLSGQIDPSDFVERFFALWKRDRDAQWEQVRRGNTLDPKEQSLCGFLDRIFTACDCYSDRPENPFDISEAQLREEVAHVARERWSYDAP